MSAALVALFGHARFAVADQSALGPSIVSVAGTQLIVQKRLPDGLLAQAIPYVIRGVNWSPASRGTATTPTDVNNANIRRPEFGAWYLTDIPLMKAMNVNTVRLFIDPGVDTTLGPIGLAVLDELHRHDIMVIMTVDDAINDLARIQLAVPFYRNHPAILMWSLGSEWNISRYFRGWTIERSAEQTEVAARLVKSLDTTHPVVSSYGELHIDAPGLRLADTSRYVNVVVPSVDLWSINLFRGNSFDDRGNVSAFDDWASLTTKPVFLGEFGIDAFHGRCLTNPPSGSLNLEAQAAWTLDLWHDVARNLSATNPAHVALGGAVFEWNDEWWKVPPPGSQQTGGWTSDGFPDWHGTEEYFGSVDIDRVPRPVYAALAAAFHPQAEPPPHTMTFRAISRGANTCGPQADFRRDGHTFYQRFGLGSGGRGFNVAVADPASGEILDSGKNFDTWGGGAVAKQALIDYLTAVADGELIMLAVADEAGITLAGTQQCTPRGDATTVGLVQLLHSFGSTRIDEYCWRGSWAMVTVKGTGVALAEAYARTEEARAEHALIIPEVLDADGDGLPDAWETHHGLDPLDSSGDDGEGGDPDGDGVSNRDEFERGTHPRGFFTLYMAEGATGSFFATRLALANPTDTVGRVLLRYQKSNGHVVSQQVTIPSLGRVTIDAASRFGLESAEFSTHIEADVEIVADRTMSWDGRAYGAHAERGIDASLGTTWYFAEGATHSGFELFYLVQNPSDQEATVEVSFLRPSPAPALVKTYQVGPQSRFNVWVNHEALVDPQLASLAAADVSAVVRSVNGVPIVAERAMYRNADGVPFGAGHASAGMTAPSTHWFLAEGATGPFFDLFVLVANPGPDTALLEARYLLPTGEVIARHYPVAGRSRFNVWVDLEDAQLADTAVSTVITSLNDVPVVVERAMWWSGQPTTNAWHASHNSPGSTVTGTRWALAEGETGGASNVETYILVANTSDVTASIRVTLLFEDATTAVRTFEVQAHSRFNVAVASMFPESDGRRYGALIESLSDDTPAEIVVERAMYWDALGRVWAAGTNALASLLREEASPPVAVPRLRPYTRSAANRVR